jgi:hypothetical protein
MWLACKLNSIHILGRNLQTCDTLKTGGLLLVEPVSEVLDIDLCPEDVRPPICFLASFGVNVDFKMCLPVTFFSST